MKNIKLIARMLMEDLAQIDYEWTAINSHERLQLLRHHPPLIPDLVGGDASEAFRQIFEV